MMLERVKRGMALTCIERGVPLFFPTPTARSTVAGLTATVNLPNANFSSKMGNQ
jgi:hypothetical protein